MRIFEVNILTIICICLLFYILIEVCLYLISQMYSGIRGKVNGIFEMILCSFLVFLLIYSMIRNDIYDFSLETTLSVNYNGYTNLDDKKETFIYDGQKYSYDYDYDKKKLIVFKFNESKADAVYINGQLQD